MSIKKTTTLASIIMLTFMLSKSIAAKDSKSVVAKDSKSVSAKDSKSTIAENSKSLTAKVSKSLETENAIQQNQFILIFIHIILYINLYTFFIVMDYMDLRPFYL